MVFRLVFYVLFFDCGRLRAWMCSLYVLSIEQGHWDVVVVVLVFVFVFFATCCTIFWDICLLCWFFTIKTIRKIATFYSNFVSFFFFFLFLLFLKVFCFFCLTHICWCCGIWLIGINCIILVFYLCYLWNNGNGNGVLCNFM